jgi:Mlc titration factor MtfA (ptsG expression regulator)
MFGFKRKRRRRLMAHPFPTEWHDALWESLPYYRLLSDDERREHQGHVQILMREKRFEGCGGLELDETMCLIVAAQAALLMLGCPDPMYFPALRSILLYPDEYEAPQYDEPIEGMVIESVESRLGESAEDGAIALSWRDVWIDAADYDDGFNVVLHEFAHQLDCDAAVPEARARLGGRDEYQAWTDTMREAFNTHQREVSAGTHTLLDEYGAEDAAEFFAVVTEAFFEHATLLRDELPELYEQMRRFYGQDTATRLERAGASHHEE